MFYVVPDPETTNPARDSHFQHANVNECDKYLLSRGYQLVSVGAHPTKAINVARWERHLPDNTWHVLFTVTAREPMSGE